MANHVATLKRVGWQFCFLLFHGTSYTVNHKQLNSKLFFIFLDRRSGYK